MLKKLVPTVAVALAVAVAVVGTNVALAGTDPTIGADGFGDPNFPQDGNGGYLAWHYDVAIDYDPAKPDYLTGDVTMRATTTQELSRFDLDLKGFAVSAVTVAGAPAKDVQRVGEHELVITPASALRPNSPLTVRVRYAGRPGAHWMTYRDDGAVRALGEPRSASDWYPVNDYPADKATMALTVTVPDGWAAVADGFPGPTTSSNGHTSFRYREDRPVAPHVTGLAIDQFTLHRSKLGDGTPVLDAYAPAAEPESKPQEDRLPEILEFLSSKFGPYPFGSAGGIFTSAEPGGAGYELQQRPVYGTAVTAENLTTIVHENAHQWFGDSVTVGQWRDIAIAEAFAMYAEWLWNECKQAHNLDNDYRSTVAAHKNDPEFWQHPVDSPEAHFTPAYTVGPLLLHALRRTVGDTVFFRTLQDWTRLHRGGNASWLDFERLARSESGTDLTGFFQAWAHSTTVPADRYLYPASLRP
jgi:aminopeptidase N